MAKTKPVFIREKIYEQIIDSLRLSNKDNGEVFLGRCEDGMVFELLDEKDNPVQVVVKVVVKRGLDFEEEGLDPFEPYEMQMAA
jgi:hypothetical protein